MLTSEYGNGVELELDDIKVTRIEKIDSLSSVDEAFGIRNAWCVNLTFLTRLSVDNNVTGDWHQGFAVTTVKQTDSKIMSAELNDFIGFEDESDPEVQNEEAWIQCLER